MIFAVGCDHAGYPVKDLVMGALRSLGYEVIDEGVFSRESADYPDYAKKVALDIENGRAQRGVLICGSGIGVCIAASKFKGVRPAIAHDVYSAAQGVEHDDMNVLCLGARVIGDKAPQLVPELVKAFAQASFCKGEERHERRTAKVAAFEKENFK